MSLAVQHADEFTTVRRENDGWVLGAAYHCRALDGWSVSVIWPLGVRDGTLYETETDAIAAIGRHQFSLVRAAAPRLRRPRRKIS